MARSAGVMAPWHLRASSAARSSAATARRGSSPLLRATAALAAAGMANKEIAGRLSVSVRTVENHLQRVYEKLGVARRADLAQALSSL